jgi:hypothetical protein
MPYVDHIAVLIDVDQSYSFCDLRQIMQPSGRKQGRAPFGDVSNSNALGVSLNHQITRCSM